MNGFKPPFASNSKKSGFIQSHFSLQTDICVYVCWREVGSPQHDPELI